MVNTINTEIEFGGFIISLLVPGKHCQLFPKLIEYIFHNTNIVNFFLIYNNKYNLKKMIKNYNNFILESKLDKYFNGEISYEQLDIERYLVSTNESITETILSKIETILFKAYEWSLIITYDISGKKGLILLKNIVNVLSTILKFINKIYSKNKKICALIIVLIVMITVGVTSAYGSTNPSDPNLIKMANAALGFIHSISEDMISDGLSANSIRIAESILTEIREKGELVDYNHVSKEAQALANSAMKHAENISTENPKMFDKLVDIGSKISSQFTRNVNGFLTVIGSK